jgi:hypothetical protein
MSKFRDWCLATGLEETKYRAQDFKVSSQAMRSLTHSLPQPYTARRDGVTEAPILKALIEGLNSAGIWCSRLEGGGKIIHTGTGARLIPSAMVGLPDVLACIKGQLVALEVKAPGGKLSAVQHAKLLAMQEAGATVMIVCDAGKAMAALLCGDGFTCKTASGLQVF